MNMFTVKNPFNNRSLGEFPFCSAEETDTAIARLYVGKKKLRAIPYFQRAVILENLGRLLAENAEKLAQLITSETGKTISDSRVEVRRSQNTVLCAASEAKNIKGEALHSDAYPPQRNRVGIVQLFPLGTVLAITPFNFPLNIAMHKIGPAFAAGNAILFKPSPQNYLSAKEILRLCYEAGISEDVLQMCVPDVEVMNKIVADPRIDCINFTGGTKVAKAIAKNAGFKKLLFELGGNDPLIVMDDADIDLAVKTTIQQRFGTAGQRCTACKRIYVHNGIYNSYKEKLVSEAQKLQVGDPSKDDTFVGPLVNKLAADEVFSRIQKTVELGASVLLGNKRENNIIFPTILENVTANSPVVAEETFGPVIPLFKFSNLDTVITSINSSNYGLQSGVFTQNISVAKKLYAELEVGALAVNDGPGFRAEHFPFGGVKDSGIGREGVYYAIREMSFHKTLIM
ncbi:aldehyde dehydrogenase family protein [Candidatus Uabimicrobium sp. HlEnr_7]|uniref:sulfoacetaldehyde dehydrogenase SafD n=1 Tax=Candidatus Uabimicrobium helgolandensis TaxID=3095367 RepID=UPI0035580614